MNNPYLNQLLQEFNFDAKTDALLFKTLHDLLTRPSVTPEDGGCQQALADLLAQVGFKALNANKNEVINTVFYHQATPLKATTKSPIDSTRFDSMDLNKAVAMDELETLEFAGKVFCFAGHTDVVPVGQVELWKFDPFSCTITEGKDGKVVDFDQALSELEQTSQVNTGITREIKPLYPTSSSKPGDLTEHHCDCQNHGHDHVHNLDYPELSSLSKYYMHSRGATDMKTGLVCSVIAAYNFVKNNPNHQGTVIIVPTSDEEGPSIHGTKYVVEELQRLNQKLDYAIVAEPSCDLAFGDVLRVGRRGSTTFKIEVQGIQGHVAFPSQVANPIHRISKFVNRLSELELDQGNEQFPPSSLQIVDIHAGDGTVNLVPGLCRVMFNIRFNNIHTYKSLQEKIINLLDECGLSLKGGIEPYSVKMESSCSGESFVTNEDTDLVNNLKLAIQQVTNHPEYPEANTAGGTSDGRFIAKICPEVVEFGITDATLHKVNELLHYVEAQLLYLVYSKVLKDTLK